MFMQHDIVRFTLTTALTLSCALPAFAATGSGSTAGSAAAAGAAAGAAASAGAAGSVSTGVGVAGGDTARAAAAANNGNFNGLGFVTGGGGAGGFFDVQRKWVPPARVQQPGPMELVRFAPLLQPTFMGVRDIIVNGHVNRVSAPIVQEYIPTAAEKLAYQRNTFARVIPRDRVLDTAQSHKQKSFRRVIPTQVIETDEGILLKGGITRSPQPIANGAGISTGPELQMPNRIMMVPSATGTNVIGPNGELLGKRAPSGAMIVPTAIGPAVIGSRGEFRGTYESMSRNIGRTPPMLGPGPGPLYNALPGVTAMRTLFAPGRQYVGAPLQSTPLGMPGGYAVSVDTGAPTLRQQAFARLIPRSNATAKKRIAARRGTSKKAAVTRR
jgi:hypothetical protein